MSDRNKSPKSKLQTPKQIEILDELEEDGIEEEESAEIINLRTQLEEVERKYKRALADYQNLERQTRESQIRFAKLATQGFVEELIGPYDHLLLAAKHVKDKGLDMVIAQFRQVFETQGLKEIHPLGQVFDPLKMEAVDTKDGEEGKVIEVASRGYELNGIIIKPAQVIVGKRL